MVKINLHVAGVEQVRDGVILMLIQDKMQIPVANEPPTDESRVVKKMMQGFKAMGFGIDFESMPQPPNNPRNFRTYMWMTMDDYESMGRPTVGDMLAFDVTKTEYTEMEKNYLKTANKQEGAYIEAVPLISKPITPLPATKTVLFRLLLLQKDRTGAIPKDELIEDCLSKTKLTREDIENAILKLIRRKSIYETEKNYLSATNNG